MKQKTRRTVPGFLRQAIRQTLGVTIATTAGYFLFFPLGGHESKSAQQWLQGCKWAAITIVVVTAPVLGKVTQVSFERALGTVLGGIIGYACILFGDDIDSVSDITFTGAMTAIVAFAAVLVGWWLNLEYSSKLFVLTFLLVIMGSDNGTDAFLVMLTRVSGILMGVFLSIWLSVLIFPKSASHQATDCLAAALQGLSHLARLAWSNQFADSLTTAGWDKADVESFYVPISDSAVDTAHRAKHAQADQDAECEKVLMDVYAKLSRCDEFIPLAQSERYFSTIRGRWCFLPSLPCMRIGSWQLPHTQMTTLATCIRKVARVLWAVHVTFQEGFEEEVMATLRKRYPATMMQDLQSYSQAVLQDMADAFPDDPAAPDLSLQCFLQAAQDLIRISDEQRRFIINLMDAQAGQDRDAEQVRQDAATRSSAEERDALDVGLLDGGQLRSHDWRHQDRGGAAALDDFPRPGSLPGIALVPLPSPQPSTSSSQLGRRSSDGAWHATEALSPRLDAAKVEVFPQTQGGYISKVRWYSFQFLMQQLAEEIQKMHVALTAVLDRLPNARRSTSQ